MMKKIATLLLFIPLWLTGLETALPSFTGPLIAPHGQVIPYGDLLFQTYLSFTAVTGRYNNHWNSTSSTPKPSHNLYSIGLQEISYYGITPWCDLNLIPRVFYQFVSDEQSAQPGDLTLGIDIQLLPIDKTPYFPGIKLAIRENFPTGNYQCLRPKKMGSDATGDGTFATQFDLVLYKIIHLKNIHWLTLTFSNAYMITTPVRIHGFNAYGGGFGTKGTLLPGNQFRSILSFELSLSRIWALALDTVYIYTEPAQFFGQPGITLAGSIANFNSRCSKQLNFAPAIEANFGPHFGIIGGGYFSALGKNSSVFRSAMINFNYFY